MVGIPAARRRRVLDGDSAQAPFLPPATWKPAQPALVHNHEEVGQRERRGNMSVGGVIPGGGGRQGELRIGLQRGLDRSEGRGRRRWKQQLHMPRGKLSRSKGLTLVDTTHGGRGHARDGDAGQMIRVAPGPSAIWLDEHETWKQEDGEPRGARETAAKSVQHGARFRSLRTVARCRRLDLEPQARKDNQT